MTPYEALVSGSVSVMVVGLLEEIDATYAGYGNPSSLVEAARTALLWVLIDGENQPLCADSGGLPWLYAFTSEQQLAQFGVQRDEGDREWPFLTMPGWRLFDDVILACPGPTGVAINVAGAQPMMFPPVLADD